MSPTCKLIKHKRGKYAKWYLSISFRDSVIQVPISKENAVQLELLGMKVGI